MAFPWSRLVKLLYKENEFNVKDCFSLVNLDYLLVISKPHEWVVTAAEGGDRVAYGTFSILMDLNHKAQVKTFNSLGSIVGN